MTIYFDENKKAYSFEISNPIATIDDATWMNYATTDKWDIINGVFSDITETDEYKAKVEEAEKIAQKADLQSQINAIDTKRIRAIAEPAIKDSESGQTWLEYYTEQIQTLREQISSL